jgi:tRNA(Ile)-lysidine synthetase-like protein
LSGGADSTALLLLLNEWCQESDKRLLAITVDHSLRKESSAEAEYVANIARKRNISHQVHKVNWNRAHGLPISQLQRQARVKRYEILKEVCMRENVTALFVGHNLGDQIETILMRMGRGSGWSGLAGMSKISSIPNGCHSIALVRPLLDVDKEILKETCWRFGQEWVEDPSNDSEDFDRIRIRKVDKLPAVHTTKICLYVAIVNSEDEIRPFSV